MEEIQRLPDFQRKFVREAVCLVKVGGFLTYSTCTINPMENERMVEYFLRPPSADEFGGASVVLEDIDIIIPHASVGAVHGMGGCGLTDEERVKVFRFEYQGDGEEEERNGSIGFFLAKFKRVS